MSRKKSKIKMEQISISLPTTLVAQIDQMASDDNRNRSNFIAKVLSDLANANNNISENK